MHRRLLLLVGLLSSVGVAGAQSYPTPQLITAQPSVISMSQPSYLTFSAIPGLQTEVGRITEVNAATFGTGQTDYEHVYATMQHWNSDGSRLFLVTSDTARGYFLHGTTYAWQLTRTNIPDTPRWSGTDPDLMYGSHRSLPQFVSYVPSTGVQSTVHDFASDGFSRVYIGNGEGSASNDGRYWPLVGVGGPLGTTVIVWDVVGNTEVGRKTNVGSIDHASISQDGNFVLIQGNPVEVYNRSMVLQRTISLEGTVSHADRCVDTAGNQVYVGIGNNYNIRMARMSDGVETNLLPGSGQSGLYSAYNIHVSCRNTARPGWAYIGTYSDAGYAGAYMLIEIYAVKLDGSGNVERWSQNFACCVTSAWTAIPTPPPANARTAKVTASPTGDRVLFASDWGVVGPGNVVHDHLVRMPLAAGTPATTVLKVIR